jgi:HEAT repeat protein
MRIISLGLAVVLLTGCARRTPPPPVASATVEIAPVSASLLESAVEGSPEERWARQIDAADLHARQQAIIALGQQGETGYRHLLAGLHSKDPGVRLACLQAMSRAVVQAHQDDLWAPLAGMLQDRSPQLRKAVVGRLDLFRGRTEQARGLLRQTAGNDPDDTVRHFAADVLIRMDGSAASLRRLLADANPLLRKRAAEALGAVPGNGLPVLGELEAIAQNDGDPAVQQTAAEAVALLRKSGRPE